MKRSPLTLAALAQVALPARTPIGVRKVEVPIGFDGAEITYDDGEVLAVRAPNTIHAGINQEAEIGLLEQLDRLRQQGELPFAVPRILGSAPLAEGGHAVVMEPISGQPFSAANLEPGALTASLGAALAAIHRLPPDMLETLGLPTYSAADYRQRHLAELDAVAESGLIPPVLLQRWESSLDDVSLWRFQPVVLHGDLAEENLLTGAAQVTAITGWGNARVADPADDLSWLLASVSDDTGDAIMASYFHSRPGLQDARLVDRAMLLSELALTRWLDHGVRNDLPDVVADATGMLRDLAAAVS